MQEAARLVAAALVAVVLGLSPAAMAQQPAEPAPATAQPAEPAPAERPGDAPAAASPAEEGWGDQKIQGARSKAPATGEPYRWRQMLAAGGVIALMALFIVWQIRRSKRDSAAR